MMEKEAVINALGMNMENKNTTTNPKRNLRNQRRMEIKDDMVEDMEAKMNTRNKEIVANFSRTVI
jgi:hypothetical protein